jgi:ribosome maturation factor RimP
VSSPGLERPLRKKEDYLRFSGRKARIKLREPVGEQKVFTGNIARVEKESVVLVVDGKEQMLPFELIRKARLSL